MNDDFYLGGSSRGLVSLLLHHLSRTLYSKEEMLLVQTVDLETAS